MGYERSPTKRIAQMRHASCDSLPFIRSRACCFVICHDGRTHFKWCQTNMHRSKHWLALLAVATNAFCSSQSATAIHVASCRPPASELLNNGIGIVTDVACLSRSDSACLNGPCRFCQKFRTKLSKGYRPCSHPIPLHKPVAVLGGVGAAPNSSTGPVKTVSSASPSSFYTVVLTTRAPSPAPTTTAPKPTRTPTPAPSTSPLPAPRPSPSQTVVLATVAPSSLALALQRPTTTATTPAQGFDPELIDCRASLTPYSEANGVDAVLDLSCAVLDRTCLKTRRCTTLPPLRTLDATSCINEFCRLCLVKKTELSSRYLACKAIQ